MKIIDIIKKCGGYKKLSEYYECQPSRFSEWVRNESIPHKYWLDLIDLSKKTGGEEPLKVDDFI